MDKLNNIVRVSPKLFTAEVEVPAQTKTETYDLNLLERELSYAKAQIEQKEGEIAKLHSEVDRLQELVDKLTKLDEEVAPK